MQNFGNDGSGLITNGNVAYWEWTVASEDKKNKTTKYEA